MAGLAKVSIIGNLGSEPEVKVLPSGTTVVSFSVAVNRRRGEEERTDWYRVSAYGKQAEGLSKLADMGGLAKGRQVYVGGRLEPREYEGRDGTTRTSLDVNADEVQVLGGRPSEGEPVSIDDVPF